jgi:hypothetical protein
MAVLEQQPKLTVGRVAAAVTMAALVVFWIYIFVIAKPDPGDHLADQTFPRAAEPLCKATLDRMDDEGLLGARAGSAEQRIELLERADVDLNALLVQLKSIAPREGEAAQPVQRWLGDWDIWMQDRRAWADALRTDAKAPFLETGRTSGGGRKGEPNSKAVDHFAKEVNAMPSCATPEGV